MTGRLFAATIKPLPDEAAGLAPLVVCICEVQQRVILVIKKSHNDSTLGCARIAATFAIAALIPTLGSAQGQPSGWQFQVTPYLWMAGLGGTIRPYAGASTVDVHAPFSELLKDLKGAAFLTGLARRDRLVLLGDFSYSSISKRGDIAPGVVATGVERQTSVTLEAGYQAVNASDLTLDLLGGLRAWKIHASVEAPLLGVQASTDHSFVDPVIAVRVRNTFAPKWSLIGYADVGGFGVGSKATWQVVGTVNYNIANDLYVSGGYRHLALDYRKDGTVVDVRMSGPMIGLTWTF